MSTARDAYCGPVGALRPRFVVARTDHRSAQAAWQQLSDSHVAGDADFLARNPALWCSVVFDSMEFTSLNRLHIMVCVTVVCMKVDRISVTMDPDLGQAVRDAASRSGVSVSRWLSDAAGDHLRNQMLGDALDTWEAEDGPFSKADLDAAARTLGMSTSRTR